MSVWLAHHFEKGGIVYCSAISRVVAISGSRVVPIESLINSKQERQVWPSWSNMERLFNKGNALLKKLSSIPF